MSFESDVEKWRYRKNIPRRGNSVCQGADAEKRKAQPCSGTPAYKDNFKTAPPTFMSPSNQNAPPLLNGNSGMATAHSQTVKTSLGSYLGPACVRSEMVG